MTRRLPQSTAYTVVFKLFLASDHVTPATGKTVAITLSKAGAAFGNPAAGASNATEIANGWYKFALGTGDTNTLGDLVLVGTATACDSADIVMMVVDATNGGATNLDAAVTSRLAPSRPGVPLLVDVYGSVERLAPDAVHANSFTSGVYLEIADQILNRDMSDGADDGADDLRTPRQALRFLRNKWTVEAGVLTVYDETDSGVSWTATLSSTPGADPITGSDPA